MDDLSFIEPVKEGVRNIVTFFGMELFKPIKKLCYKASSAQVVKDLDASHVSGQYLHYIYWVSKKSMV